MTDQHIHTTPAALRAQAEDIVRDATALIEALDLYEDVYADEISEEISRLSGRVGVRGHTIRRAHLRAHKRDAAFADEVNATLDQLPVAGHELSLLQESEALEARFFGDLLAGPDEDREDRIAREHDERSADWQRAVEEDDQ